MILSSSPYPVSPVAKPPAPNQIADNRRARFEYHIEEEYEAGLVLEGWEVKSMRQGRAQLKESHVAPVNGELYLIGAHISPPATASTHIQPDPRRRRKLLLSKREIDTLIGLAERRGYTLVPLKLYWRRGRAQLALALGRGKKLYDKRHAIRDRDWQRDQQRLHKAGAR